MGENFNIGDIVRLKSGGPAMTVESIGMEGPSQVRCVWIDAAGAVRAAFPDAALEIVPPTTKEG